MSDASRAREKSSSGESILPARLHAGQRLILFLIIVAISAAYFATVHRNPPGYYIDESSISFNAHTISQTGRDEFGEPWPLYFRAFGDYKNPVHIYLLAGIYRMTGPSILVARWLSAACGVLAALGLGLLATRLTKRSDLGLLVTLMALLTPWLFEMSRVVMEVALYPLVIILFLLCAHLAAAKGRWSWREVGCLAAALALVTYTYSIGRVLGPLFAFGLIFFASRARRLGVISTWVLYAISLVPLVVFNSRHPGALTGRFGLVSYLKPPYLVADNVWEFAKHYMGNLNPWRLLVNGDPNIEQIAHIDGWPLLLAATGILAAVGLLLVLRQHRSEAWWRLVLFCLIISPVPASLTKEYVHMLRLSPLPVLLIVLTIPAIQWLWMKSRRHQIAMTVAVVLMIAQGAVVLWKFEAAATSPKRLRQFDHGYPDQILGRALNMTERPIYLADALAIPGYIQAYWYATLRGVSLGTFTRLASHESPPVGALVISTEENCPRCRIIATSEFYTLYTANAPAVERVPLPDSAFRARLDLINPPTLLAAGQLADFRVLVRNDSSEVWPARERSGGTFQVSAGNHWLHADGKLFINDDGRAALLGDLRPGEVAELKLTVNTPKEPGSYILEIDLLQEGVSWFGLKGSPTLRLPVRVE